MTYLCCPWRPCGDGRRIRSTTEYPGWFSRSEIEEKESKRQQSRLRRGEQTLLAFLDIWAGWDAWVRPAGDGLPSEPILAVLGRLPVPARSLGGVFRAGCRNPLPGPGTSAPTPLPPRCAASQDRAFSIPHEHAGQDTSSSGTRSSPCQT